MASDEPQSVRIILEDWFTIAGRGSVVICSFTSSTPIRCPVRPGDEVLIEGNPYEVLGVETSMLLTAPPRLSERFGILVRGERVAPAPDSTNDVLVTRRSEN